MQLLIKRLAWYTIIIIVVAFVSLPSMIDEALEIAASPESYGEERGRYDAIAGGIGYAPILLLAVLVLAWKHRTRAITWLAWYVVLLFLISGVYTAMYYEQPLTFSDVLGAMLLFIPILVFGILVRNRELQVRKAREAESQQQERP